MQAAITKRVRGADVLIHLEPEQWDGTTSKKIGS